MITLLTKWREKAALRPKQVAEILSVSERVVRRMIEDGTLTSRLQGGCRLVPTSAILEIVGEGSPQASATSPPPSVPLSREERRAVDLITKRLR